MVKGRDVSVPLTYHTSSKKNLVLFLLSGCEDSGKGSVDGPRQTEQAPSFVHFIKVLNSLNDKNSIDIIIIFLKY